MKSTLSGLALALLALSTTLYSGEESIAQREARLAWWRDARFGMFLHYGPVTLTGKEISWSRANSNPRCPNNGPTSVEVYDSLYRRFVPTNFNASDWAGVAKSAGMKYVVLTAKHCDGFLLWNSKVDGYNIASTPFKRDICAELSGAVRRAGLRMGWYFSPMDWRDPDCRTERNAAFIERMKGELSEVLGKYGRIDLMWFDWDAREALYDQARTYALVKKAQPRIIINNRLDLGIGDNDRQIKSPFADYYTPEQQVGAYDDQRPWETCMTLGTQWSWKPDDTIKTSGEVIRILARTAGADGNLLLNVGPMPDGRIEPRQIEVLKHVGAWMKKNGESIYGTRGGPFKPADYGASTRKGMTVYIHILKWDGDRIVLPDIARKVKSARLLTGRKAEVSQADGQLIIHVPDSHRDQADTVVCLRLDGSAMDLPAMTVPHNAPDGVNSKTD